MYKGPVVKYFIVSEIILISIWNVCLAWLAIGQIAANGATHIGMVVIKFVERRRFHVAQQIYQYPAVIVFNVGKEDMCFAITQLQLVGKGEVGHGHENVPEAVASIPKNRVRPNVNVFYHNPVNGVEKVAVVVQVKRQVSNPTLRGSKMNPCALPFFQRIEQATIAGGVHCHQLKICELWLIGGRRPVKPGNMGVVPVNIRGHGRGWHGHVRHVKENLVVD